MKPFRVFLCIPVALALFRNGMDEHGAAQCARTCQNADKLMRIMPVDRPEVGEAHFLKQLMRQQKVLDAVFEALHPFGKQPSDRPCIEQTYDAPFEAHIAAAHAHVGQLAMNGADVWGDRHIVIVQYDDKRHVRLPRIVHALERKSARHCAVSDERDCRSVLVPELHGARHAERSRDRR